MTLKIIAGFLLLLLAGSPVLIAGWWLFPVVAGICVWAFLKYGDSTKLGKFLKPLTLLSLILFLVWLCFLPWKAREARSMESVNENNIVARIFGETRTKTLDPSVEDVDAARRRMLFAIEDERLQLMKIASGLELLRSAQSYATRHQTGSTDIGPLISALSNLQETFRNGASGVSSNLLDPDNLQMYVKQVTEELNKIQIAAEAPNISSADLNKSRLALAERLDPYNINKLWGAVGTVENALRQILKADIGAAKVTNDAIYDRNTDSLTLEQIITIDLSLHPSLSIDLSSLFEGASSQIALQVAISQDGHGSHPVDRSDPEISIEGAKQLRIVRRLTELHASYPVLTGHLWQPVRAFSVTWPLPLSSSLKLNTLFQDSSNDTWPYSISVNSDQGGTLAFIEVPPDSYFFSEDLQPPAPKVNKLVPSTSAPRLVDLVGEAEIRVELLPSHLSNRVGQQFKDYLEIPTIIASLLVALGTALLAALVKN